VAGAIVIERRYRGPEASGNGGYSCGLVAAFLDGDVEVTLRLPPPLERPLHVERLDGAVQVLDGDRLVAEARSAALELEPPGPIDVDPSEEQPDDPDHPFPQCFVCGPARPPGDGLGLRPAPLDDGRVAAPWTPTAEQAGRRELVWAALDCPGAFAVDPGLERGVSVLGRLHARVDGVPEEGERCLVVGWALGGAGRKQYAGTALYGRGGRLLGLGCATWVLLR
jgi:hypothetical protein